MEMMMNKTKMLVFDMDNTLNLFYEVDGWLEDLHNENVRPYVVAKPKVDMVELREVLLKLKDFGWKIVITSWLAKNSTHNYDTAVRKVKTEWLNKYNFPYDEVHYLKYGRTKADATRGKADYQILFDDNENVRKGWTLGDTVNADTEDILAILKNMLVNTL